MKDILSITTTKLHNELLKDIRITKSLAQDLYDILIENIVNVCREYKFTYIDSDNISQFNDRLLLNNKGESKLVFNNDNMDYLYHHIDKKYDTINPIIASIKTGLFKSCFQPIWATKTNKNDDIWYLFDGSHRFLALAQSNYLGYNIPTTLLIFLDENREIDIYVPYDVYETISHIDNVLLLSEFERSGWRFAKIRLNSKELLEKIIVAMSFLLGYIFRASEIKHLCDVTPSDIIHDPEYLNKFIKDNKTETGRLNKAKNILFEEFDHLNRINEYDNFISIFYMVAFKNNIKSLMKSSKFIYLNSKSIPNHIDSAKIRYNNNINLENEISLNHKSIISKIISDIKSGKKFYQPILAFERDGYYHIFDGCHRYLALSSINDSNKYLMIILDESLNDKEILLTIPRFFIDNGIFDCHFDSFSKIEVMQNISLNNNDFSLIKIKGLNAIVQLLTLLSILADRYYVLNNSKPLDLISQEQ